MGCSNYGHQGKHFCQNADCPAHQDSVPAGEEELRLALGPPPPAAAVEQPSRLNMMDVSQLAGDRCYQSDVATAIDGGLRVVLLQELGAPFGAVQSALWDKVAGDGEGARENEGDTAPLQGRVQAVNQVCKILLTG